MTNDFDDFIKKTAPKKSVGAVEFEAFVRGSKPKERRRTSRAGQITGAEIDGLLSGEHGSKIRNFFGAIKKYEGGQPNLIVGGKQTFDPNGDHPNIVGLRTAQGNSTAAGDYQITGTNWYKNGLKRRLGAKNFNPENQLRAAIMLFADRDNRAGINALLNGDYEAAEKIAAKDWAALPSSRLHPKNFDAKKHSEFLKLAGSNNISNSVQANSYLSPSGDVPRVEINVGEVVPTQYPTADGARPADAPPPITKDWTPFSVAKTETEKAAEPVANTFKEFLTEEDKTDLENLGNQIVGQTSFGAEYPTSPIAGASQVLTPDTPENTSRPIIAQAAPPAPTRADAPKTFKPAVVAGTSDADYKTWLDYKNRFEGANLTDSHTARAQFHKELADSENFGSDVEISADVTAPETNAEQTTEPIKDPSTDLKLPEGVAANTNAEKLAGEANSVKVDVSEKPKGINAGRFLLNQGLKKVAPRYGLTNEEIDSYTEGASSGSRYWDSINDDNFGEALESLKAQGKNNLIDVHVTNGNINDILQRRAGKKLDEISPELETEIGLKENTLRGGIEKNFANAREIEKRDDVIEQIRAELQERKDRSPFNDGSPVTLPEINKELEFRLKTKLPEEQIREHTELGQYFNKAGEEGGIWGAIKSGAGQLAGGAVGTAVQDFAEFNAGIARAVGWDFARREFTKMAGGAAIINTEALKEKGFGSQLLNSLGATPYQASKFILLSGTAGGSMVAFATDHALREAGRGGSVESISAEAAKGLITGALFHGASKLAQNVEQSAFKTLLNAPFKTSSDASLSAKNAFIASKFLGEGVRVGSIGGATFAQGKIEGQSNADAMNNAAQMMLLDLIQTHGANPKEIAGKIFRVFKNGESADFTVDLEGGVLRLPEKVEDAFVDAQITAPENTPIPKPSEPLETKQFSSSPNNSEPARMRETSVNDALNAWENARNRNKSELVETAPENQLSAPEPAPENRPLTESVNTISKQVESAASPDSPRIGALVTNDAHLNLIAPEITERFTPIKTEEGVLLVNNEKAKNLLNLDSPEAIQNRVIQNGYADILGKVEDLTGNTGDGLVVVRTTDANGKELSSSVVNQPENVQKQKDIDASHFPNEEIRQEVTTVQDAIQKRGAEVAEETSQINKPVVPETQTEIKTPLNPVVERLIQQQPRRAKTPREKILENITNKKPQKVVEKAEPISAEPIQETEPVETAKTAERSLPKTLKEAGIDADSEYYKVFGDEDARKQANDTFNNLGLEKTIKELENKTSYDKADAVLSAKAQRALLNEASKAESAGDLEYSKQLRTRSLELGSKHARLATEAGQFNQAAGMLAATADGVIYHANKIISAKGEKGEKISQEVYKRFENLGTKSEQDINEIELYQTEIKTLKERIVELESGKAKPLERYQARVTSKAKSQLPDRMELRRQILARINPKMSSQAGTLRIQIGKPFDKTPEDVQQYGAGVLLDKSLGQIKREDFYKEMRETFGGVIDENLPQIFADSLSLRNKLLEKARTELETEKLKKEFPDADDAKLKQVIAERQKEKEAQRATGAMAKKLANLYSPTKAKLTEKIIDVVNSISTDKTVTDYAERILTRETTAGDLSRENKQTYEEATKLIEEAKEKVLQEKDDLQAEILAGKDNLRQVEREEFFKRKEAKQTVEEIGRAFRRLEEGQAKFLAKEGLQILGETRSVLASGDLSGSLRQGFYFTVTNPVKMLAGSENLPSAFGAMFGAVFKGNKSFADSIVKIENHPNFDTMQKMGVEFASAGSGFSRFSQAEENVRTEYAKKIPILKGWLEMSENTYAGFLDTQRALMADSIIKEFESQNLTIKNAKTEYEAAARLINIATGRGDIAGNKMLDNTVSSVGKVLFAPRYAVSRFQLLNHLFNPVSIARMPPAARRIALKRALTFHAAITLPFLAMGAAGLISLDPDDDDFLKIRIGEKARYELTGGLQTYLRFVAQMGKAGYDAYNGDLEGGLANKLYYANKNFWSKKLAPVPSYAYAAFTGKEPDRTDFHWLKSITSRITPITIREFAKNTYDDGALGFALTVPSIFGVGLSYYPDKTVESIAKEIGETAKKLNGKTTPEEKKKIENEIESLKREMKKLAEKNRLDKLSSTDRKKVEDAMKKKKQVQ